MSASGQVCQVNFLTATVKISMFSMRLSLISERQGTGIFADHSANPLPCIRSVCDTGRSEPIEAYESPVSQWTPGFFFGPRARTRVGS